MPGANGLHAFGLGVRQQHSAASQAHDSYALLLTLLLAGYALFGKGFAYVGVPPIYIGEIVLALGCLVLMRCGSPALLVVHLPLTIVALMIGWVVARAVPFISTYGIDVPRDAMVVLYALFAFIVVSLLLEKPERLIWALTQYRRFACVYGYVGGFLFAISVNFYAYLPAIAGTPVPAVRPGEAAVHLAGAVSFAVAGFMRVSPAWVAAIVIEVALISPSRGATLAFLVPVAASVLAMNKLHRFLPALLVAAAVFCASLVADIEIPLPGGERPVGAEQMLERLGSIMGESDDAGLDGTKQWRLNWWAAIRGYTFDGPYFWTGKGFGVNLAIDDNFVVGERGGVPLRSPHSAHMTLLARAGVPGLMLWIAAMTVWFLSIAKSFLNARARGDSRWAGLFVWIACYAASALINASFDVALEGPMQGIWFWCLYGLGVAMAMMYRVLDEPARTALAGRSIA